MCIRQLKCYPCDTILLQNDSVNFSWYDVFEITFSKKSGIVCCCEVLSKLCFTINLYWNYFHNCIFVPIFRFNLFYLLNIGVELPAASLGALYPRGQNTPTLHFNNTLKYYHHWHKLNNVVLFGRLCLI